MDKTYVDPAKALKEIIANDDIDFSFLEIRMNISGLDVAKILRNKARLIIFATSYKEYAIDAFGSSDDSFLVKPLEFSKLLTTVNGLLARENRQKIVRRLE